jgi:hypothetical protein
MAIESLNDGQRAAYNGIIDAYATHHAKIIFIDGLGGTNKTYTENLILNVVHSCGNITLVVASLGIAALTFKRANGPFVPEDPDRARLYVLLLYP